MNDIDIVATGLKFPEGPIAMTDGTIIIVEVAGGNLTRVHPNGETEVIAHLGGGPNGAAIGPDGHCYVCNNGGFQWVETDGLMMPGKTAADYNGERIERVNLETGECEVLYADCAGHQLKGPNDIVFDETGGFWFTDTGKPYARTSDFGGVYYARTDGSHIEEILFGYDMPNGVGLSAQENTLYFAETMRARLWKFVLASPGRLQSAPVPYNPADLLYSPPGLNGFDSMAVDSAGNVCQATLFNGGISVVPPDGSEVELVKMPDPLVTNICFGGDDLRTAYITLGGSGRLVKTQWPRPGLALNFLNK